MECPPMEKRLLRNILALCACTQCKSLTCQHSNDWGIDVSNIVLSTASDWEQKKSDNGKKKPLLFFPLKLIDLLWALPPSFFLIGDRTHVPSLSVVMVFSEWKILKPFFSLQLLALCKLNNELKPKHTNLISFANQLKAGNCISFAQTHLRSGPLAQGRTCIW